MADQVNIDDIYDEVYAAVKEDKYDFRNCATRIDRDGPYHVQDILAAAIKAEGVISEMARLLGRKRHSLKDWIDRNHDMFDFLEDMIESNFDLMESNVIKEAKAGNTVMAWRVLSNSERGRRRGYGSAQTLTVNLPPRSTGSVDPEAAGEVANLLTD